MRQPGWTNHLGCFRIKKGDAAVHYFKQSPHDGLCGFYAAINAVHSFREVACPPLNCDDMQELFDEAVECLFRVPGCDLRILKGDPAVGGIDSFQVRDLCVIMADRFDLPLSVALRTGSTRIPFATRYRTAYAKGDHFAFIVPYRDDSHWVAALPHDKSSYRLVDEGRASITRLRGGGGPKFATHSIVELSLPCLLQAQ